MFTDSYTIHRKFTTTYCCIIDFEKYRWYNREEIGGGILKVGIHIDRSVEEIEVLITAQERNRKVDALYQHIVEFDKSRLETLTAYRDDIAKIVNVADIFRIYTGNQKVYIQTHQGEYVIRYRLYELNEALDKKQFLRISNSEIVNVKKIRDIDLSIIGRICIRFEDNRQKK